MVKTAGPVCYDGAMMEKSCTTGIAESDDLFCRGFPRDQITIITPVPKPSQRRGLNLPGCDLIVAVRDRGRLPSPLTGRPTYIYRLISCGAAGHPLVGDTTGTGRSLMSGARRLFHEADIILGTDGYVFKNRFGDQEVDFELVHPQKGGTELQAAADWYENECKGRS